MFAANNYFVCLHLHIFDVGSHKLNALCRQIEQIMANIGKKERAKGQNRQEQSESKSQRFLCQEFLVDFFFIPIHSMTVRFMLNGCLPHANTSGATFFSLDSFSSTFLSFVVLFHARKVSWQHHERNSSIEM